MKISRAYLFLLYLLSTNAFSNTHSQRNIYYLQLQNKLDRPDDGYCIDVVGSGQHIRLDMPLTAHNCKGPQTFLDEVVQITDENTVYFPAYQGCVTVMGNNTTALPNNALMLKPCLRNSVFLNAERFQRFEFNLKKQLQLKNSALCVVVGDKSHTTYSMEHKWRALYMENCSVASLALSQWQLVEKHLP